MQRLKGLVASVSSAAVLLVAPLLAIPSAQATPVSQTPHLTVVSKTPMTIQRQVSAVTKGRNVVVKLDNGRSFSIPATAYRQAQRRVKHQMRPNNTVFGNCGYSYTYLYDWGVRTYRLAVGFHVDAAAVAYSWGAYVNGAGSTYYEYHYTASGGLAYRHDWAGGHTGTVPRADGYDADTYYGAAELWYGNWCFAGYTSDYQYVN